MKNAYERPSIVTIYVINDVILGSNFIGNSDFETPEDLFPADFE